MLPDFLRIRKQLNADIVNLKKVVCRPLVTLESRSACKETSHESVFIGGIRKKVVLFDSVRLIDLIQCIYIAGWRRIEGIHLAASRLLYIINNIN